MRTSLLSIATACLLTIPVAAQTETAASAYDQQLRPQVHFSPRQHWMNDPNGLVYFEGEYHLFFQYNPLGETPGHIGWGHAVSRDLLHWQELAGALPEANGEMIFTGSVVVDTHNSSKLCTGGKACLVAIYTGHRDGPPRLEAQDIAVSQDRGRTWQRYAGNPVLDLHEPEFRDPAVSWNEQSKSWIMAVSMPNDHKVLFYSSPDLKAWTQVSSFGPAGTVAGQWECPDLLRVPATRRHGKSTWALKVGLNPGSLQGGSGEQYFLGAFDGKTFTQSTAPGAHGWTDYGKDSYCAISYNGLRAGKLPTLIGWMDNWQYADKLPTAPWRGQMTLPRRLTWLTDSDGQSLRQQPVTAALRQGTGAVVRAHLAEGQTSMPLATLSSPAELNLRFTPGATQNFSLRLYSDESHWTEVGFDRVGMRLYVDRTHTGGEAPANFPARTEAPITSGRLFDLELILDRSSLEVFAQNGTIAMTNLLLNPAVSVRVELRRDDSAGVLSVTGRSWPLKSIWTSKK